LSDDPLRLAKEIAKTERVDDLMDNLASKAVEVVDSLFSDKDFSLTGLLDNVYVLLASTMEIATAAMHRLPRNDKLAAELLRLTCTMLATRAMLEMIRPKHNALFDRAELLDQIHNMIALTEKKTTEQVNKEIAAKGGLGKAMEDDLVKRKWGASE
jgi:hypothetical protein